MCEIIKKITSVGSSYVPRPDSQGRILQLVQPEPAFILVTALRLKDEIMYTSHVSRGPSEHSGTDVLMCKLINSLQGCFIPAYMFMSFVHMFYT